MHFVSCILIVGIGVDYGIFITNVLKENSTMKEIKITLESNLICALSTVAAFGVLALARHNIFFSLGITMFTGILFSFLTSYLAIPFIIGMKKSDRMFRRALACKSTASLENVENDDKRRMIKR